MIFGTAIIALGVAILLFAGGSGGINSGNIILGALLLTIGVFVAVNDRKENVSNNESREVTHTSKEKMVDGNRVTTAEETTTRKTTNERTAAA